MPCPYHNPGIIDWVGTRYYRVLQALVSIIPASFILNRFNQQTKILAFATTKHFFFSAEASLLHSEALEFFLA
ncbi:MAG: hypothetical protein RIM23_08735 [Coleofasciculus sp. G3-WIS-01]|uniref:hypothetical protein n=1 Tax=Coleofasciculus sp. G3-WIS-01 TaxID=3069528 RepID=UPI003303BC2D